jgi:hypothetical protein
VNVAVLAVMMVRALNIMFFEPPPRSKVIVTIVAYPVTARVLDMLVVSRPGVEITVTAITIGHLG